MLSCEIASALLAPFIVDKLSRLALRDLARYRSRSGAALTAVSFAVFIATIAVVIASIRYDDALDYTGPNMAANQLILYNPGNDPTQYQPGQFTPAAKLAATRQQADTAAAQLHAPAPLELDLAVSANVVQPGQPTCTARSSASLICLVILSYPVFAGWRWGSGSRLGRVAWTCR
jgi:putative ABC transport system permease protein